jgi:1-deoxy-D-xylulose-5-phosphate reductoisomerase
MKMKRLAILGSTGSIGRSALAVVTAHPDRLQVVALVAGENTSLLAEQIALHHPLIVGVSTESARRELAARVDEGAGPDVLACGREGLIAAATHPDVDLVLCATSGTAGLEAALAAIDAGKTLALANKEVLVMAGALMVEAARRRGVAILPVDSEHNAIHQCLQGRPVSEIRRLILTASGGPFRGLDADALERVTPEDALRHPTWQMGRKITIDSATLMNKGLEVIEAHWLFDVRPQQIDVLIHPQSIVHSLVELTDGSVIAQLGLTDMRLPIQYAFSYPERWPAPLPSLDLTRTGPLEFATPDTTRFPCLALAYQALDRGGASPVVLNAANEVAVDAFLAGAISLPAIPRLIARALDAAQGQSLDIASIDGIREVDDWTRRFSTETISTLTSS